MMMITALPRNPERQGRPHVERDARRARRTSSPRARSVITMMASASRRTKNSVTSSAGRVDSVAVHRADDDGDRARDAIAAPSVPICVCRTQARLRVSSAAMMISVAAYEAEETAATTCAAIGSSLTPRAARHLRRTGRACRRARGSRARGPTCTRRARPPGGVPARPRATSTEFGTPAMMPSRPAPAARCADVPCRDDHRRRPAAATRPGRSCSTRRCGSSSRT